MAKDVRKRAIASHNESRNATSQKHTNGTANGVSQANESIKDDYEEIQDRIRRLENMQMKQTGSSSNVFKFAFFFFMGVVLTIILYPKISTTLDSVLFYKDNSHDYRQLRVNTEGNGNAGNLAGDQLDTDREKRHSNLENNGSVTIDSNNVDRFVEEEHSSFESDETTRNFEPVKSQIRSSSNENTNREMNNMGTKPMENKVKFSRSELMIDETIEDEDSDMISLDDDTEDIDTNRETEKDQNSGEIIKEIPMTFSTEPNDRGEEVKLFKANFEDTTVIDETNNDNIEKIKEHAKDKGKAKVKSVKENIGKTKPSKTKHKDKTKPKSDNKAASNKDDQTIPDEVKHFKATFQKTVTPKKVFIDGRRIPPMELLPQKPNNSSVKIWLFEEFLSEAECDGLMRVHNKHVQEQSADDPILCFDSVSTLRKHLRHIGKNVQVTPRDFTQGTTCVNATFSSQLKDWFNGNWSYSTAFYPGESVFATAFENRVQQAMGLNPENGGKFQITSYPLEIGYKAHTDCTEGITDKRDRMATVLVYLDTVEEGGETEFTELGIWAKPRKGRALMWNNMDPEGNCEPMSIHKANKVLNGHKFILQRWYYYQSFYSLGKRPPEPPLPIKKPGQPRVSCDEYENGSCRWYDEWNFEHMIEYERQKYTLV